VNPQALRPVRDRALRGLPVAALALGLAGCATVPPGPALQALPGSRMTPEQFAADDARCRAAATARLGGVTPAEAANQSAAASTVAGTAIGAVSGALMDGSSGAAVGAGMGLLYGALAGVGSSQGAYAATQQQFDALYFACMYARGHKVPVPANDVARHRAYYESVAASLAGPAAPPPPDAPPPDGRPPGPPPPR
jgi:hypothetical protein